jgi:hypothetical protein
MLAHVLDICVVTTLSSRNSSFSEGIVARAARKRFPPLAVGLRVALGGVQ